ncbi:MAG: ArsR/SmtB family transcription factor [Gammaproteobacteria bacterium]
MNAAPATAEEVSAPVPRPPSDEDIALLAKALGHPARVGIVRLLLARRSCIGCDIVDQVHLAQSTVSEHLRILKAAGIITGEIERPRVCYSLNPAQLEPLRTLLAQISAFTAAPTPGDRAGESA